MAAAGPDVLGRGVVIGNGQTPPDPWVGAAAVVVDDAVLAAPADAVAALHAAWAGRRPVVVVLAVDPARFRAPLSLAVEPWTLPADFEVPQDRLHFAVWANTYDARSGEPVWWWARKAVRLGARLGPPASGCGDITLPDGRGAWVDGGPRAPIEPGALGGAGLVHRETVERGRLEPAPPPVAPDAQLAADQLAAVAHGSGPARVIAPAGSGKTRVLTERLRHLVTGRGWERDAVLAVAYNKRAQEELDARTVDFQPRTRTLNSLGYAVVADARGARPDVISERDARGLIERLAPVRRRRANTDPIGPYLEALGRVRLGLVDPEIVEAERDDVPGLAEVFPRYRAELRAGGAVDFDEQIYGAVEALIGAGELRARWQSTCRHLLVDEFQDLTPAHVVLLRLLAAPGLDVFGVGDDDQVIYGHAGADPGFLIGYDRLFPAAGDHPLEVNYRCPPAIVAASVNLLSYNRRRVPKAIRAGRRTAGDVQALDVRAESIRGAVDALVGFVQDRRREEAAPTDIAVLCRVNSLLLAPQVALVSGGVAVTAGVDAGVLDRTGLRAALAYLRLATAGEEALASHDLIEILRRPSRGLPPWFADRLRRRRRWSGHALLGVAGAVPGKEAGKVERLADDVIALRTVASGPGGTTASLLRAVREDVGLGQAMGLLDDSRGEGSSHLDDLEALEQVAALHPDPGTFESWLRTTLADAGVPRDAGVTLATVHRVKGMEWDHVVLWGANAGILPHRLAEDEEEERRVFHVAITRARQRVLVLADRSRPSPFLTELDGTAPHRPAPAAPPPKPPGPTAPRSRRPAEAGADPATLPAEARALEEALRAWRSARSRTAGVPAYVVASDRTLRAIVEAKPRSLVALRQVSGIGPTKLELYGDEILAILAPAGAEPAPPGR